MHFLGLAGMPRRIPDYPTAYAYFNYIASFGSLLSAYGIILFHFIIWLALFCNNKIPGNTITFTVTHINNWANNFCRILRLGLYKPSLARDRLKKISSQLVSSLYHGNGITFLGRLQDIIVINVRLIKKFKITERLKKRKDNKVKYFSLRRFFGKGKDKK